jgi:hypothetical protein
MPATAAQRDDRQRPRRQGVHEDRERRARGLHRRMSHGDCSAAAASMPSGCSSTWNPRRPELPQRDAGGPVVVVSEDRGASVRQVRWDTAAAASIGSAALKVLRRTLTAQRCTDVVDALCPIAAVAVPTHLHRRLCLCCGVRCRRCCSLCGSLSAAPRRRPSRDARDRARTPVQPCAVEARWTRALHVQQDNRKVRHERCWLVSAEYLG